MNRVREVDEISRDVNSGAASSKDKSLSSSADFTSYGLSNIPRTSANTTAWGRTKTFAGLYQKEWLFLIISTINILAAMVLTIIRLVDVVQTDSDSPDLPLTILILINAVFCAYYVYHGVLKEREFEVYAFIAAILVIVIYCIAEYSGNMAGQNTIKLVRLIAACVVAPPNIFFAWSVARDFGYLEFKVVGASPLLQSMYKRSSIFASLLQFDLQISLSFIVLVLVCGTDLTVGESWSLAIGIPFCLVWSLLGLLMLYREIKVLVPVFFILGIAKPAYILFRITKISLHFARIDMKNHVIIYATFVAGALDLLLFFIILFELLFVVRNFNQGLRDRVYDTSPETAGLLAGQRSARNSE